MSRQECIEGINDMLEKLHSKDLKRMNDFISGFTFALVRFLRNIISKGRDIPSW